MAAVGKKKEEKEEFTVCPSMFSVYQRQLKEKNIRCKK